MAYACGRYTETAATEFEEGACRLSFPWGRERAGGMHCVARAGTPLSSRPLTAFVATVLPALTEVFGRVLLCEQDNRTECSLARTSISAFANNLWS